MQRATHAVKTNRWFWSLVPNDQCGMRSQKRWDKPSIITFIHLSQWTRLSNSSIQIVWLIKKCFWMLHLAKWLLEYYDWCLSLHCRQQRSKRRRLPSLRRWRRPRLQRTNSSILCGILEGLRQMRSAHPQFWNLWIRQMLRKQWRIFTSWVCLHA